MAKPGVWRFSAKDSLLVALSLTEVLLKLLLLTAFARLTPPGLAGIAAALIILNCMNYECAGHYFLHSPFFRPRALNSLFGLINSLAYGFPQTLYRTEHLNHHRYGSDHKDPATGRTGDASSIYRFGPGGSQPEPMWRYALLSPFRQEGLALIRATPKRLRGQLILEIAATLALLGAAAWVSPFALLLLLFISWAGSAVAHFHNWLRHAHARPGSRLTDSVSSYGWFYNLIWFNNGYHQEHHYRPATHWSALPELRPLMLPESQRRVVPHAHLWNRHPPGAGAPAQPGEGSERLEA
jgi:fatty acid desaturase